VDKEGTIELSTKMQNLANEFKECDASYTQKEITQVVDSINDVI